LRNGLERRMELRKDERRAVGSPERSLSPWDCAKSSWGKLQRDVC